MIYELNILKYKYKFPSDNRQVYKSTCLVYKTGDCVGFGEKL